MSDLSKNLVVRHNDLVMASYEMTVHEQNVLFACISQLDSRVEAKPVTDKDTYIITVEQARDLFYDKGDQNNAYRDLEFASRRLFERKVELDLGGNKTLLTRFVQSIEFDSDAGAVTLQFATKILPYLTQLQDNFTKYRMGQVVQLSSIHARRLFELIVCWAGQQQWQQEFDMDEFRKLMNVGGKYSQFGQLKQKVINIALEQINESSDFHVSVGYRKVRRSFKFIQLKYHRKATQDVPPAVNDMRDANTPDMFHGNTEKELNEITKPLTKKQADKFTQDIVRFCKQNSMLGAVHELGSTLPQGLTWYEAKDHVHKQLQHEKHYKKYRPVLKLVGYKELK